MKTFLIQRFHENGMAGGILAGIFAGVMLVAGAARAANAEGPLSIDTKIEGHHATVTVGTRSDVRSMEMQVYGLDGLEVIGADTSSGVHIKTIRHGSLGIGETWTEQVDFTPGDGLSSLNVLVKTEGQPSISRAYSVGELSEKQKAERAARARLDAAVKAGRNANP